MPTLYTPEKQAPGTTSSASIFKPGADGGAVNVVGDYWWTLTPPQSRKEIPSIVLTEYEVDESLITRQIDFYVAGVGGNSGGDALNNQTGDFLSPYDQLFPKDKWTGFYYVFPFYSDINFEVNTPQWASLDTLEAGMKGVADIGDLVYRGLGQAFEKGAKILGGVGAAALAGNYPKVGIMDRPKLWESHDFRSYTIKIPLYNTYNPDESKPEWIRNRELCELLVNNNLYNKTSFITGIPPVFYEVLIPGQHYTPAACVTNLTIYNRGNIRLLYDAENNPCNVPDVYEINMTLTDLVIPSKNLFQGIKNETVRSNLVTRSQQGITAQTQEAASGFLDRALDWLGQQGG